MKTAIQQIEDLIFELQSLSNKENKLQAEGTLKGLCKTYFSMGLINQEYLDNVMKRAKINMMLNSYNTDLKEDDWIIPYD